MNADKPKSYKQACRDNLAEARIQLKKSQWRIYTDEELLQMLRDFNERLGHTPTEKEVDHEPSIPCCRTYQARFGSFTNALESAGFKVRKLIRVKNDEMIQMLRDFGRELGHTPTRREVDAEQSIPDSATYRRRFGSLTEALVLAGFEVSPGYIERTDEELLELLRLCAKRLGHAPTSEDLRQFSDVPSKKVYINRFGSFSKAIKQAGLEEMPNRCRRLSDEEMLRRYIKFAEELDRRPTCEEIDANPELPSAQSYRTHFGSLDQLGDSLGIPKSTAKPAAKSTALELMLYGSKGRELLQMLRDFGNELGHTPSAREVDREPGMPCVKTFARYFGSFSNAILAAGFTQTAKSGPRGQRGR